MHKNYVSQHASNHYRTRKNNNIFGSYNIIEMTKWNHIFKVCVPDDDWKMKIPKLFNYTVKC